MVEFNYRRCALRTWIRPGFLVVFPLLAIACVGAESTSTPMPVLTPTVTPGPTPTTTPNSTCNFDQLEIYVSDADGSNETRLTYNPAHDSYPSWSPDGSKIAFQSRRDGTQEIYVMDADGSNQTRLTTNNDAFSAIPAGLPPPTGGWDTSTAFFSSRYTKRNEFVAPAWSPDGGKIAFVSTRDPNFEIYVMDADGSNQIRLTYLPGTTGSTMSVSPSRPRTRTRRPGASGTAARAFQSSPRNRTRPPSSAGACIAAASPRDRHNVPRAFGREAFFLARRRAHGEAAGRDHHHLRAFGAVPERLARLEVFLRRRGRERAYDDRYSRDDTGQHAPSSQGQCRLTQAGR